MEAFSASQLEMFAAPSTSSSEELPANHSASQDSEADLLTAAATSHLSSVDWLVRYGPRGSSGKMYQASSAAAADGTLAPSSGRWLNSGMGSHGEFLTLATAEFHSAAVESSLSEVLQAQPLPERYFLSPRACAGILRRAKKRGKTLPEPLAVALEAVAGLLTPTE